MNLHEQLDTLIAAQNRTNELLEALAGLGGKTAGDTAAKTTGAKTSAAKSGAKTTAAKKEPAVTVEQARDAAIELKELHGATVVKEILTANGVAKLAEMKEDQAEPVYKACIAKKEELDNAGEAEDDI